MEKVSLLVSVLMFKIMGTPIKVGVRTYTTYTNCQTLSHPVVLNRRPLDWKFSALTNRQLLQNVLLLILGAIL